MNRIAWEGLRYRSSLINALTGEAKGPSVTFYGYALPDWTRGNGFIAIHYGRWTPVGFESSNDCDQAEADPIALVHAMAVLELKVGDALRLPIVGAE